MAAPPPTRRWHWRSEHFRALVYQVLALVLVLSALGYLMHNTLENMRVRGIKSGFDFMTQPAGFAIGESLIPFDSSENYIKAFIVGLGNTLRVALAAIVLGTVLGTLVAVGRLSNNLLLRSLCASYVEIARNIPLLLQLFIWYFVLTELLPPVDEALRPLTNWYFSKNGLQFPHPSWAPGHAYTLLGLLVGALLSLGFARWARRRREATGRPMPIFWPSLLLIGGMAVLGWLLGGAPTAMDVPEKTEITVVGGGSVTPEYLTMLFGLVFYSGGYIAEVVRAGIQSVPYGQHEAAVSLGLNRGRELQLVQLPQALRVIIPPMTSQYLNMIKNSSLAVAVGYPDLVSISNTSLNQTGRAIECIAVVMAVYLSLSLITSALMNLYNARVRIRER